MDWGQEPDRAAALFEESLTLRKGLAERHAGPPGLAIPLGNLAQLAEFRGHFVEGRRLAEESLAAARVEENDVSVVDALEELAWLALFERRHDAAAQLADKALRIVLAMGALGDADSMMAAALLHASRRNPEDAARLVGTDRGENPESVAGSQQLMAERFPDGVYADVAGFCKIASIDEIGAQGWSLNPGRYVGAANRATEEVESPYASRS